MRTPVEAEFFLLTLAVEDRDDGGLFVTSRDVPGLYLSGAEGARIWSLVPETVAGLLRANRGWNVVNVLTPPLPAVRDGQASVEVEVAVQLAQAA